MRASPPRPSDTTGVAAPFLDDAWHANCPYMPYFCEENVWQLCRDPALTQRSWAVLVINRETVVPMWAQRAQSPGPILWDYHAVVVADVDGTFFVVDADCTAGGILPVGTWLAASFRANVRASFQPSFRVIAADTYAALLATDRRHMIADDGTPMKPLPPWPPPGADRGFNLDRLINVDDDIAGDVLDLQAFAARFAGGDVDLPMFEPEE